MKNLMFFIFLLSVVEARIRFEDPHRYSVGKDGDPWVVSYTDVMFPVDHYAYTNVDKFRIRYLYNSTYYKPGGAIFFYAGNEGAIENFARNTGIMFDLAPEFNAMVVFAEHRYYGDSMPYSGNASWAHIDKLGYLTSIQALADYAMFLPWFRNQLKINESSKVIVFGGSYGAMLAAWFRMKFPALTAGAWASSAPLMYFNGGGIPVGGFDSAVQKTFIASGCSVDTLVSVFKAISKLAQTDDGMQQLRTVFKMDPNTPLNSTEAVHALKYFIQIGLEYMAMTDYPYETNFLNPMPAWPVTEGCKRLSKATPSSSSILQVKSLWDAASVFYNYTGKLSSICLDTSKCKSQAIGVLTGGPDGWDFQECTEIIIPMCSLGPPNDFFDMDCNSTTFKKFQIDFCTGIYGGTVGWNSNYMNVDGVKNLYGWDFSQATNIIFTNGKYDPWSAGRVNDLTPGIKDGQSRGVYNFLIDGSAHHLDLRQPMSCDPQNVVNVRFQIVQIMKCWVNPSGSGCPYTPSTPPTFKAEDPSNCGPIYNQYPWGQSNFASGLQFSYSWKTDYVEDLRVDHFGYTNADKFKIRYLYNLDFYKPGGPIFFYPGNEGDIEDFAKNSGIIWDLAPLFNATVLFVEHRYWGKSLPYGDDSFKDLRHIGFMTSIQAIADYVEVLSKFKQKLKFPVETKVIAVGGSYGGMLGAWMKLKYPTVIEGVWASSAPVVWFEGGGVPVGGYGSRLKKSFNFFGCENLDVLYSGFVAINNFGKTSKGLRYLSELFKVDPQSPLIHENSVKKLISYIQIGIENMGMTNYPYETTFLQKLPPYPINESCQILRKTPPGGPDTTLAEMMKKITNIYYNSSGTLSATCIDGNACGTGDSKILYDVWDFQKCTEIIIELCEMGPPNDFFLKQCSDRKSFVKFRKNFCKDNYEKIGWKETSFRENAIGDIYGFDYSQARNIIFTNGGIDPWGAGGVTNSTPGIADGQSRNIYNFFYEGSAHHLDLRQPNTCDPENVHNVRFQVVQILRCFLNPESSNCPFIQKPLPDFKFSSASECNYIYHRYPWGQK